MTIRQNFDVNQGATFSYTFTYRDASGSVVDLTGYHARMSVRYDLFAAQNAYLTDGGDAIGGSITLGTTNGHVTISMTPAQSDGLDQANYFLYNFLYGQDRRLPFEPVIDFMYDLELVAPSGAVDRALQGCLTLHRAVTS